jgi:hypothetical protein
MALDPNISLGVKPLELTNPLAQYGQIAAIQNAQNQNALAQFQLGTARRQEESQNVLADVYKRSINPETGAIDNQALLKNLAASNAAYLIPDVQTKLLASEKERGLIKKTSLETEEKEFKLKNDKLNFAWNAVGSASTPQDAIQKITEGVRSGVFDMKGATTDIQQLQNMTPEQYQQYRVQKVMGILDAKDKLGFMLPKTRDRDIGGVIQTIQDNPALPGYSMPIAGMAVSKTPTFAEQTGQGQLNLARAKFDFEQANPTLSIQEDPSGLLAVNMRTGVATPVVYGPMGIQAAPAAGTAPAPAAAPGASLMRQPPAALPGQRVPAIPGMASVLDQTTAPAAMPMPSTTGERVPGQPVTAKKALPEAYAKQAMGVANTNDSLEKLLGTMKNFKSSDMLNPTRRAELGQAHATTLLFAKELFNLGVLNGGDERIVNSVINNPVDFSSTAVPIEAIRKQARDLQGVVDRTNKNLSTVYKMPLLKLDRSTPSEVANDIHSQAEAILRGTPPRGNP